MLKCIPLLLSIISAAGVLIWKGMRLKMAWEITLMNAVQGLRAFEGLNVSRRIDRVRLDNALQSLRQIFFYSSELTRTLEEISRGEPVDPEVVEYFAREFRAVPIEIDDALGYLQNEKFESRNTLRIEELNLMSDIRAGKLSTRRDVSQFFQDYGAANRTGERQFGTEAARVLGQIERLNSAIRGLEAKLLGAQQSGGAKLLAVQEPKRSKSRRPVSANGR